MNFLFILFLTLQACCHFASISAEEISAINSILHNEHSVNSRALQDGFQGVWPPDDGHPCNENCTHTSGCNPDPHYYGWDLSYYDFQGACDQIAIDNPILQLQIRTRPRQGYSTVTEVGFLLKSTGETFNIMDDGNGTFITDNQLTAASAPVTVVVTGSNTRDIQFNANNFIRINTWGGGISVQVQGQASIFYGSEGMYGSWNHGGIRFRNGTHYDTSGGYSGTRATSHELAVDWKVIFGDSLMNSPNDTCIESSACGPGEVFDCGGGGGGRDQGRNRKLQTVDDTCSEIDCSNISVQLHKEACEEDILLTGDPSWACEPSKLNPVIEVPGPNDFVPHPSDEATGQGGGDPHFETFNGEAFSYHGECDLVMMKSPSFASGLGLDIHIRTTRIDNAHISYSYISAAAVRIGTDVLEAKDDGSILINGLPLAEDGTTFAGFPVIKTIKGSKKKIFVYDLILGEDDKSIQIRANLKTGMLFVDMIGNFKDSVGLMGRAGTTKGFLLARDGMTNLAGEWNTFGEEWQVQSKNEPKLFAENRAPQHPAGCLYQSQQQTNAYLRRRLMDDSMNAAMTIELAAKACENLIGRKKDFCISDVMATGDLELAEDPFYG